MALVSSSAVRAAKSLTLRFQNSESLVVDGTALMAACSSQAIREIIGAAMQDNGVLQVSESKEVWTRLWELITQHMTAQTLLTWDNVMPVLEAADKYSLDGVLPHCSVCLQNCFIATKLNTADAVKCTVHPYGAQGKYSTFNETIEKDIEMMVTLLKHNLIHAYKAMMGVWISLLTGSMPNPDHRKAHSWPVIMKALEAHTTGNHAAEVIRIAVDLLYHHP